MEIKNSDFVRTVEEKFSGNAFSHLLGVRLESIRHGEVSASLDLKPELLQQNGIAHGGVLMSLCDIVAGFAAFTVAGKGEAVVTASIQVNCMRPARGKLLAIGRVDKAGRNIFFCSSEIYSVAADGSRTLVSNSSSTMAVARKL